ncbi:MAG: hypothetical protein EAZ78_02620 [Oscillatoriales cyanobacterium]|nr:MAG: hypothetical protein EAZ98_23910 [Oscillatoriales cyanobacterium]TAE06196.1 MAG: hypothetical protein EAZ96_03055 [Oscillatoriales cyanobacterium]TAF06371.1 MAG: hypothetical protein EAZ78_02620 [Oscillatoriales cyanobacterium]TAF64111.1 MAG: hypothetical protein EAZ59_19005 [Oscillatoriales cyanobacterium]
MAMLGHSEWKFISGMDGLEKEEGESGRVGEAGLFHSQVNHRFVGAVPRVPALRVHDFVGVW